MALNLTMDDIRNLREIGNGTEGRVFKYDNKYLLKIYRKQLKNIIKADSKYDKYIKIYDKNSLVLDKSYEYFNYFITNGDEDVRIRNKDGLKMAIERQKLVKRSVLPIDIVYINGLFAGCLLEKANGIQIHKLIGMPVNLKRKIVKNLLLDIEELLNNYIYHVDIANSPFSIGLFIDEKGNVNSKRGHSHVLINPINLNTSLIDLDGKSTIYMERYNYNLEQKCLMNLTRLIIEFLFKLDTDEIKETDELYYELLKLNLSKEVAYNFSNYKFEKIDEIKKTLKL